ncbi:hypothetical protein AK830_g9035 [Neonectria ditissima]|uniref:Uncharacterized protein n=1 Tax=Neonectria ditissima TaxID=78410 RepID=A0A0N8H5Z1_9HYPO|nr:hypothetical protein AK830_g9035 [Neonectria ditissima]
MDDDNEPVATRQQQHGTANTESPAEPFSERTPSARTKKEVTKTREWSARLEGALPPGFPPVGVTASHTVTVSHTLNYCCRAQASSTAKTLVIGVFDLFDREPREIAIDITDGANLFWKLKWGTLRLRGIRAALLSLKSVRTIRLYKRQCFPQEGFHRRIILPAHAIEDMRNLVTTYKMLHVSSGMSSDWADWITSNINEENYALEIVFDWSPLRVSIALLMPMVLSLAIGLWFNSRDWTDLATIQTAWGVASYVVTAASLLAGLLALLTALTTADRSGI